MNTQRFLLHSLVLSIAALSTSFATAADVRTVLPAPHKTFECAVCHNTAKPENIPNNAACLSCHGPMDKLVQATSKYALNPHTSPHWGEEIPCGTCHKQHQEPTVQCAACHTNQGYKVR